jgi:hypothetical protein
LAIDDFGVVVKDLYAFGGEGIEKRFHRFLVRMGVAEEDVVSTAHVSPRRLIP